jgi:hypothetical protein
LLRTPLRARALTPQAANEQMCGCVCVIFSSVPLRGVWRCVRASMCMDGEGALW